MFDIKENSKNDFLNYLSHLDKNYRFSAFETEMVKAKFELAYGEAINNGLATAINCLKA